MKPKSYLTLLLLFISFFSLAQDQNNWVRYRGLGSPIGFLDVPAEYNKKSDYILDLGISQMKVVEVNYTKKGKAKKSNAYKVYNFDNQGNISLIEYHNKDKKSSTMYTYDDKGYATSKVQINSKGNIESTTMHWRDSNTRASEFVIVNGKGDTTFYSTRGAIDSLQSVDKYYKKGKLVNTWFSEYYPNLSLKKTTLLNKKGKEKYVWDYQCKDEGVEVAKHKDTSTVCVTKEVQDNGDILEIKQIIDAKGKMRKHIYKKDKFNQYYYGKTTSGKDDVMESEWAYYYRQDTIKAGYKYKRYKKGEVSSITHQTYDSRGNETSNSYERYKKGDLVKKMITIYSFDDVNRPKERISEDSINKTKKVITYSYEG